MVLGTESWTLKSREFAHNQGVLDAKVCILAMSWTAFGCILAALGHRLDSVCLPLGRAWTTVSADWTCLFIIKFPTPLHIQRISSTLPQTQRHLLPLAATAMHSLAATALQPFASTCSHCTSTTCSHLHPFHCTDLQPLHGNRSPKKQCV